MANDVKSDNTRDQIKNVLIEVNKAREEKKPVFCIFGLGGSGKSTLFNMFMTSPDKKQDTGDSIFSVTKYPVAQVCDQYCIVDTPGLNDMDDSVSDKNKLLWAMEDASINRHICVINGTNRIDKNAVGVVSELMGVFEGKSFKKGGIKFLITRRTEMDDETKRQIIRAYKLEKVMNEEDILCMDTTKNSREEIKKICKALIANPPRECSKMVEEEKLRIIKKVEKDDPGFFTYMGAYIVASAAGVGLVEMALGGVFAVGAVVGATVASVGVAAATAVYGVVKFVSWLFD